jgi:hypothetical protein
MPDDADLGSKVKAMLETAKKSLGGGAGENGGSAEAGPIDKVKSMLGKAVEAVSGLVNKDDQPTGAGAPGAHEEPTEHAQKMKAAVEAAKKSKTED